MTDSRQPASHRPPRDLRVLLAEDDAISLYIARRMLETLGAAVEVAGTGLEAVALAEATHFDLILMDCQMPDMDGYEATTAIRSKEAPRAGRTPIIAMSAFAGDDERCRCTDVGMDDYLTKPLTCAALRGAIERWLGAASLDGRRSPS